MSELIAVDRLEICIVVDNVTDMLSTTPAHVESELSALWRGGLRRISGDVLCWASHGLSCLVTAERGGVRHSLLFDSGPEDVVFENNVGRLGLDLALVEAIVLSHGHWDHAGGMLRALDMMRARNGGREVPFYAHPDMFRSRAMKHADGSMRLMADIPSPSELTRHWARVVETDQPQTLLDGMFYVSGEIPRVSAFEQGLPGQHRRRADGQGWEPDPLLMDERFVAVDVAGKGLVVLTACSHAGIVNVLRHARDSFPGVPVYGVLGGLHLSGSNEAIIPETVAAVREFGLRSVAAGHCTGWRAMHALAAAFGEPVLTPSAVGKRFTF